MARFLRKDHSLDGVLNFKNFGTEFSSQKTPEPLQACPFEITGYGRAHRDRCVAEDRNVSVTTERREAVRHAVLRWLLEESNGFAQVDRFLPADRAEMCRAVEYLRRQGLCSTDLSHAGSTSPWALTVAGRRVARRHRRISDRSTGAVDSTTRRRGNGETTPVPIHRDHAASIGGRRSLSHNACRNADGRRT